MSTTALPYGAVQTAYVSYTSYGTETFTGNGVNLVTFWPTPYTTSTDILAATTNINVGAFTGCSINFPDANQVSLGMNIFIRADPANTVTFEVNNFIGAAIQTVAAGTVWWIQLTAYTEDGAGVWNTIQMGAGTSAATASALAGLGLITGSSLPVANQTKLNTYIPTQSVTNTYTVLNTDQSSLILLGGGSYTVTIPPFYNGYDVSFSNTTNGIVTLVPESGTINNNTSLQLYPNQTATIVSDGTNLWSLGLGQGSLFADQIITVDLASIKTGGTYTLSEGQSNGFVIQLFCSTGPISGNITVYFPNIPSNWYVSNFCATSNLSTVSIQLINGTTPVGSPLIIPIGEKLIVYSASDPLTGLMEIFNIPTILSPSSIQFPNGTVSAPGIAFQNDPSSGLYLNAQYVPTMASHGVDILQFDGTDETKPVLLANPGSTSGPSYSFLGALSTGLGLISSGNGLSLWAPGGPSPIGFSLNGGYCRFPWQINLVLLLDGQPDIIGVGTAGNTGMGIGIENTTNQIQFYSSSAGPTYGKIASLLDTSNTTTTFALFEESAPTATGYMKISGAGAAQVLALGTTADQIQLTAGTPNTISLLNNTTITGTLNTGSGSITSTGAISGGSLQTTSNGNITANGSGSITTTSGAITTTSGTVTGNVVTSSTVLNGNTLALSGAAGSSSGATTNAILPSVSANTILLYNGTNWVAITPPGSGTSTLTSTAGVIAWT
jgi:hypothetical protein